MKYAINGATTMPYSLEMDIITAAQAGFEGVEIWWDKLQTYLKDHSISSLQELLAQNKVKTASICPFLFSPFRDTDQTRKNFEEVVQIAPQIGCETIIICPDFQPARMTRQEALNAHAKELSYFAEVASRSNLRLAIEPIGGHTLVPGPMEALNLINLAGSPKNVGLLVDTFHYLKSVISDNEIKDIPLEKLYIVHINDSEDGALNELTDNNRLYPTLGVIPLQQKLSLLKEMGYEGYLSVEIFRPEYWERPIEDNVNDAYFYLDKLVSKL